MTLPQTPAARSANAPNKLAQHEANQRAEKTEGDASRPLTPLYPANPGGAKDMRMVYPPNNQPNNQPSESSAAATTGAAPASGTKSNVANVPAAADSNAAAEPQQAEAAPQQAQAVEPQKAQAAAPQQAHEGAPQPVQKLQTAKAEEPLAQKAVQDAGLKSASNHCDVQACAGAYSSFRASDCTYQPYQGPRRVCVAPPEQQRSVERTRTREITPRPEQAAQIYGRDNDRLNDSDDDLRAMPRPPAAIPSGRYDDEDDDYDAPRPPRRVIMIDPGRPY